MLIIKINLSSFNSHNSLINKEKKMFTEKPSDTKQGHVLVHESHAELFNAEWEKLNKNLVIEALDSGRGIAEFVTEIPGWAELFAHEPTCLECSDGRVCSGFKLALPGSGGVLLSEEGNAILKKFIADKKLLVTGHESCGAAAMAHPGPDSDDYGYAKIKALAQETGNSYGEIHKEKFKFPNHYERCLVLDGVGGDWSNWSEFPAQFVNSAPYFGLPDGDIENTTRALSGIALGDHGFGSRFDAEHPFYIIIAADSQTKLDHLTAVAQTAVEQFAERVKITGVVAPVNKL
jgi:hypothetical protein